jgi:hypothetical protein
VLVLRDAGLEPRPTGRPALLLGRGSCGHEGRPTFGAFRNAGQRCRMCRVGDPAAAPHAVLKPSLLLRRQQRVEGLPVLCSRLSNRRACVRRSTSGRVRAAGAVPRPHHGPLALPLFLRKRSGDPPVLRPVGNHRPQEVLPIRWPNRSRDSRRGGVRRRTARAGPRRSPSTTSQRTAAAATLLSTWNGWGKPAAVHKPLIRPALRRRTLRSRRRARSWGLWCVRRPPLTGQDPGPFRADDSDDLSSSALCAGHRCATPVPEPGGAKVHGLPAPRSVSRDSIRAISARWPRTMPWARRRTVCGVPPFAVTASAMCTPPR